MSKGIKQQPGSPPELRPVWQTMLIFTIGLIVAVAGCQVYRSYCGLIF